MEKQTTWDDVFGKLNIMDFKERIFNSNSNGELSHLQDYVFLADMHEDMTWFRECFLSIVKRAKEDNDNSEWVFQHVVDILCCHAQSMEG